MGAQRGVVGQRGFGPVTVRYVVQRVLIVVTAWHGLIVPRSRAGDRRRCHGGGSGLMGEVAACCGCARWRRGVASGGPSSACRVGATAWAGDPNKWPASLPGVHQ